MTKKPKVAYLFGAGASFHALPLLCDLPQAMEKHAATIQSFRDADLMECSVTLRGGASLAATVDEYVAEMRDLAEKAVANKTVDTYAKKLLFKSREDYFRLKVLMTNFFSDLQQPPAEPDYRYNGFLAAILEKNEHNMAKVRDGVMLLNWNYDLQLPLSFRSYYYDMRMEFLFQGLGLNTLDRTDENPGIPSVVHLNGLAAWRDRRTMLPVIPDNCANRLEEVMRMLDHYLASKQGPVNGAEITMLRFAWEINERTEAGLAKLAEHLSDCEAVVVIGYSFPYFNRDIDRAVFGGMRNLKKVYLQGLASGMREMTDGFNALALQQELTIVPYDVVDHFMLPSEL